MTATTKPTTCTLTVAADGLTCGKPAVVVHTFKTSEGFYAECAEHETRTIPAVDTFGLGDTVLLRIYGETYTAIVVKVKRTRVEVAFKTRGGKRKVVDVARDRVSPLA
jgi:hypothetical protein